MMIPVSIDMHQANYCQINSKSIHQIEKNNMWNEEQKKTHTNTSRPKEINKIAFCCPENEHTDETYTHTSLRDIRTIQMNCNISEFIRFNTLMPTFWNMYVRFIRASICAGSPSFFFCSRSRCDFFHIFYLPFHLWIFERFSVCGPQDPLQSSGTETAATVAAQRTRVDSRINYTRALYHDKFQCNDRSTTNRGWNFYKNRI